MESNDTEQKPKVAVWKFASCDGCQLTLLDCEEDLLEIVSVYDLATFDEATKVHKAPPFDISLADGSITTAEDIERIKHIRDCSKILVAIGACATAGGIQSLKNFENLEEFTARQYKHPEWLSTLSTSTPFSAHVKVDYELQGCPINRTQLIELFTAALVGRKPSIPSYSVCVECKRRNNICVMVANDIPCMGPVTNSGCGAICPTYDRGCYGCYGPMETPNTASLTGWFEKLGIEKAAIKRAYRSFYAWSKEFKDASND